MFRKKAAEVAEKIKAEVGRAGEVVIAAIVLAAGALILGVAALILGLRSRHASA